MDPGGRPLLGPMFSAWAGFRSDCQAPSPAERHRDRTRALLHGATNGADDLARPRAGSKNDPARARQSIAER